MAFQLIGNGTATSSIAVTTFTHSAGAAIPHAKPRTANEFVIKTDAGFHHGYKRGQTARKWDINLFLMTHTLYRQLATIYEIVGNRHWIFWNIDGGAPDVGSTTSKIEDAGVTFNHVDEHRDRCVIITVSGTPPPAVGEIRRVSSSADLSPGTILNVSTVFTGAPDATDLFVIGWPVRFVGELRSGTGGAGLIDASFTLEEVLFQGTV